jgi:hypothetical protein
MMWKKLMHEYELEEKRNEIKKKERLGSWRKKQVAEETHLDDVLHQFPFGRPMPAGMNS